MKVSLKDEEAERLNDTIVDRTDTEMLKGIIHKAELLLGNIGIRVDADDILFQVVNNDEMNQLHPVFQSVVGLTCPISIVGKKHKIWLLENQTYIYLLSVVAHEMTHTWCRDNKIEFYPVSENGLRMKEEGLCELVAFHVLSTQFSKLGNAWKDAMLKNPDPIYGDGFRLMKKQLEARGNSWVKFLGYIKLMYSEKNLY